MFSFVFGSAYNFVYSSHIAICIYICIENLFLRLCQEAIHTGSTRVISSTVVFKGKKEKLQKKLHHLHPFYLPPILPPASCNC